MKFSFYQATNSRDDSSEVGGVDVNKNDGFELEVVESDEVDYSHDERDETSEKDVREESRVEEADEENDAIVDEEEKREEHMELCSVSTYGASVVDSADCVKDDAVNLEVKPDDDAPDSPIEPAASSDSVEEDVPGSPIEPAAISDSVEEDAPDSPIEPVAHSELVSFSESMEDDADSPIEPVASNDPVEDEPVASSDLLEEDASDSPESIASSDSMEDDAFDSPIEPVASNDSVEDDADSPIECVGSTDSMESNTSIQSKASEISHKLESIMLDRIAAIDQIRNLLETELENGKIIYCSHHIYILNLN